MMCAVAVHLSPRLYAWLRQWQCHYYIIDPSSWRPFFNEHCLVSNMPCQYTVRAIGKEAVKVQRLHPTHLKEFLMTSEQTARFLTNDPEIAQLRKRVRHAVTRRPRVRTPPAWLLATEDMERPSTPELIDMRGLSEVAAVDTVHRARRASVIHAAALDERQARHQAMLDSDGAPLPHGRQARPMDIMYGFPPTFPPRPVRQGTFTAVVWGHTSLVGACWRRGTSVGGACVASWVGSLCGACTSLCDPCGPFVAHGVPGWQVTAPEVSLPEGTRQEVTLKSVPRKRPASPELLARVLQAVERYQTTAAANTEYVPVAVVPSCCLASACCCWW